MRIAFVYDKGRPASFAGRSYDLGDFGGSEGSMIQFAFALTGLGHKVRIYVPGAQPHEHRRVEWRAIEGDARFKETFDVVIAMRFPDALRGMWARIKALFCHDPEVPGLPIHVYSGLVNLVIVVSEHQKRRFQQQHPIDERLYLVSNSGIVWADYDQLIPKVRGRAIYCSVPERGLAALGDIWPLIRKAVPWATLHVTGNLRLWGLDRDSPQISRIESMEGVSYLGLVSREKLVREQLQSQVLLLPGSPSSPEMCCMSAMECAAARNALVVTDLAALPERVIQGYTGYVVPRVGAWQAEFADAAVRLMRDPDLSQMQLHARLAEYIHDYKMLACHWVERFDAR